MCWRRPFGVETYEQRTWAAALFVVLLCTIPCASSQSSPPAETSPENEPESAWPVNVVAGAQADIVKLIAEWNLAPDSASFTPAPDHEVVRVSACLAPEVARYPRAVLRDVLNRIVVLGTLRSRDTLINGTYSHSGRDVFIATMDEQSVMDTCSRIRTVLHHELSSILLRRYADRFPKDAWLRLNPPGFAYRHADALGRRFGASDPRLNAGLLAKGFVSEYATVAFEEDFNTVVALFMSEPTDAAALAVQHPRLREKLRIAVRFYRELGIQTQELNLPSFDPADCPLEDGPPPQDGLVGIAACEAQFVRNVGRCGQYFPDPDSKEFVDCTVRAKAIQVRCEESAQR